MGLGKTIQTIGWLRHRRQARPVIIVCPTSVRLGWQREVKAWLGETVFLPFGTRADHSGYADQPFVIIHYDILYAWVDWLRSLKPRVVVIDEAHYIKTNKAVRTRAVKQLVRGVPHLIGLTGTPIVNRPIEAFNILQLIDKTAVPNWRTYTQRYCGPRHNGFGWTYNGATHTQELHDKLTATVMLRRRKADVLTDLPAKLRSFVPIEIDNRDDYTAAERDFLAWVRDKEGQAAARRARRAQTLTRVTALRDLAAKGKLAQAVDWIADVVETTKLVVFAVHREMIDTVYRKFNRIAVKIAGDVNEKERQQAIERFQGDPNCRLFVGQIQAAGTGITLTAASHIAFLELPWTPGELLQAEDRCHRIGQRDQVTVYYLLAASTIDEDMAHLIDRKREVLNSVLDGEADATPAILTELLDLYETWGTYGPSPVSDQVGRRVRQDHRPGV
jgi:SNF2 family DNA or RNA helicase